MPATQEDLLTLEEFRVRYAGEKPYYEYWAGEAIQKSMPTSLHGLIQKIVMRLLDEIGYESASEITLMLDGDYEPVPDVIAVEPPLPEPYPTRAFEVVVEILSPDDPFSRVLRKCRLYERWGIERIIVIDPAARVVWSFENGIPIETDVLARRDTKEATVAQLWAEVDRRRPTSAR
jgi:Uma2 family endonuclease